ncbi:tRNA-uridine aminocarboxypropyltransferase [Psychromonas sp. PT13]|uniref:tRNA-uridine aminocarboxypropyltransferase n=1 Tax=Psychromonas sp. PT13 TaxID=3439547 RepID=UPI003EBDDD94
MGKRAICHACLKALPACICKTIKSIDNQHFIHILQDPSEEKKAIGTARILDLSLTRVQITVGECFDASLFDLDNCFLVFPDPTAIPASEFVDKENITINKRSQFILLDGSWKKAFKLLMCNPFLQSLPKVMINVEGKSTYRIRKSPRDDGLSTVEAGYYLLSQLENDNDKFLPLLKSFDYMIDYQISRIPADVYQKNY